ncbi:MAG TPA: PQQ-dependent sugar dehydrogenase [Gemmatimonadales bacterium]|nr:PQQ-dependent sugar dehydrogenase [Gemmatimonadales bacterium]
MSIRRVVRLVVWGGVALLAGAVLWLRGCGAGRRLETLRLPSGFTIAVFADSVPDARSLALGDRGTVFVGSRDAGVVYALRDTNADGRADERIDLLRGLGVPNGVAFRDGALYVAAVSRILRYDSIEARLHRPPKPVVVTDRLPREGHHGWRYIGFGPDGWLYVGSGAPCNICDPPGELFAALLRVRPDGSDLQVFAHGVRNTVGFDWHPGTHELWFTDNGRDWLGPDGPPDELDHAPRAGLHFGFPFCHGGTILDPDFGSGRRCGDYVMPEQTLGAHVAALGMRFYTGTMFPPQYRGQIFIAEHGSWNRVIPVGYRITLVRLQNGRAIAYEPFAQGWLRGGSAWGRPVDLLVMPDGALLVSDDKAGVVYRISYGGP